MNCSINGCPGRYQATTITHTVVRNGEIMVYENVPAEICDICSDILLTPNTVRRLEALLQHRPQARKHAPVYEFA